MDRSDVGTDEGAADFSGLYRAYAGDVRRFALFLSGDASLADDIVSETFIRMWKARARVDLATVKAYLFAIARNLYLQQRRQAKRMSPIDAEVRDTQPDPLQQARARDELRAVLEALQSLPEVDRSAVLMRADAGMPYRGDCAHARDFRGRREGQGAPRAAETLGRETARMRPVLPN